ncbi:energy transducer TonB [Flavobacterium sp.]|jgi:periplasmic protein TonB|uniref:energy transducer TonB n=1 Tax=Flavobacterium sp. TaxID=239 RepID=UPI003752A179
MSNVSIFEKKWLDLVFEGKNQEYGAYKLRQESPKTSLYALLSGIMFIAFISGICMLFSSFDDKPKMHKPPTIDDSLVVTPYKAEPLEKKIIKKVKPISNPIEEITKKAPLVVVKTNQAQPEVPTNNETPQTNATPGTNTGTGLSTNTDPSGGTNVIDTKPEIPTIVVGTGILDEQPDFPGGIDKFRKQVGEKFKTPEIDEATVISVFVSFVIEKDGSMSNIKVLKNPGFGLDIEAIRVLKSIKTKWKPGKIQGQLMRTQYTLPIKIELN